MASLATAPAIIVPPPILSRRRIELRPELALLEDAAGKSEDDEGNVSGVCGEVSICVSTFGRNRANEEMAGSPLGLISSL